MTEERPRQDGENGWKEFSPLALLNSSAAIKVPRSYSLLSGGAGLEDLLVMLREAGWREAPFVEAVALLGMGEEGLREAREALAGAGGPAGALVLKDDQPVVEGRLFVMPEDFPARWGMAVFEILYNYAVMDRRVAFERAKAEDAVRQVTALLSTRDEFFSIATHDLRNPLTTLKLSLELLHLPGTDENRQTVEIMRRNLDKMEALINDMLEVFRLYRGSFKLNLSGVQVNRVVEDAVVAHYPMAVEKDITLDFLLDERCGEIEADAFRLSQVVSNLLSNALKYTPRGGMVEVLTEWTGDGVLLSVRDTGPGIPRDEREKIFETFARGSAVATGNETSTGLGLFICRKIVELHGGRIWVESEEGKGSTFKVFLPVKRS